MPLTVPTLTTSSSSRSLALLVRVAVTFTSGAQWYAFSAALCCRVSCRTKVVCDVIGLSCSAQVICTAVGRLVVSSFASTSVWPVPIRFSLPSITRSTYCSVFEMATSGMGKTMSAAKPSVIVPLKTRGVSEPSKTALSV